MVAPMNPEDVAQLGEEVYERDIRAKVEAGNLGRFVIIDVLTGDFEVDDEDMAASDRLLERRPQALLYGIRIGSPAAYRIGFGARPMA
jgi:hypothetical protein